MVVPVPAQTEGLAHLGQREALQRRRVCGGSRARFTKFHQVGAVIHTGSTEIIKLPNNFLSLQFVEGDELLLSLFALYLQFSPILTEILIILLSVQTRYVFESHYHSL